MVLTPGCANVTRIICDALNSNRPGQGQEEENSLTESLQTEFGGMRLPLGDFCESRLCKQGFLAHDHNLIDYFIQNYVTCCNRARSVGLVVRLRNQTSGESMV